MPARRTAGVLARLRGAPAAPAKRPAAVDLSPPAYRDRHPGRTALVLGTGPSMAEHAADVRAVAERHDCLTLGSNDITRHLVPDYHGFCNRKGLGTYGSTIDPRSKVLVGAYITDHTVRNAWAGPYERMPYVNDHEAPFAIDGDGVVLTSCRTTTIFLAGVALVMGATRILFAGTDGFGAAAEGDGPMYGAEPPASYAAMQAGMGADYFHGLDAYQARFFDEIAAWMTARGLPAPEILTPTTYRSHQGDLGAWL